MARQYGLYSAVFMSVIMGIGPTMIMILAALQGVPQEMQEAAQIDGAGRCAGFGTLLCRLYRPFCFLSVLPGLFPVCKHMQRWICWLVQ